MVFTAVTIVFLPLNFFTSYYGMNLHGIIDTKHDVGYFWSVCGVSAFAVILAVSLYAFKHKLRDGYEVLKKEVELAQEKLRRRRHREHEEAKGAWVV